MKAMQVIEQLYKTIPLNSSLFTSEVDIDAISINNATVTVTTVTPHGLQTGDHILIKNVPFRIPVNSVSRSGEIIFVVTSEDTDFTNGFQNTAVLTGANESKFNGTFEIRDVQNSTNLSLKTTDSGDTVGTGTIELLEATGRKFNLLNAYHEVTVVDTTNFTIIINEFDFIRSFPAAGQIVNGFRISGAVNAASAMDAYTRFPGEEYWMYVTLAASAASKDRKNNSDSIYVHNQQTGYRQEIINTFIVYVITNASDTISAREIRDEMEDVAALLIQSLCGAKFRNSFNQNPYYSIVFDTHAMQFYDKGTYIHSFTFQTIDMISEKNIFIDSQDVALRTINLNVNTVLDLQTGAKEDTQTLTSNINVKA